MAQVEAGGALSHLNHEIVASLDDFQDPSQEWRRLFSELFGTFFLVLVAAGGGMMGQAFPGTISRAAAVVAPGLMVMAMVANSPELFGRLAFIALSSNGRGLTHTHIRRRFAYGFQSPQDGGPAPRGR